MSQQLFIQKTKEVWALSSEKSSLAEDVREISANMTTLFKYLAQLDKKYGLTTTKSQSSAS